MLNDQQLSVPTHSNSQPMDQSLVTPLSGITQLPKRMHRSVQGGPGTVPVQMTVAYYTATKKDAPQCTGRPGNRPCSNDCGILHSYQKGCTAAYRAAREPSLFK